MMHNAAVTWTTNNHGYPYKAFCECGWQSRGYVAVHAAQSMADGHLDECESRGEKVARATT
jgi:hypothetical protein